MYDLSHQNTSPDETHLPDINERRSGADRRQKTACGFTCISIVGWICRREQLRRKDDPDTLRGHSA